MYDDRTNLAQQVTAELKKFFGDKLFKTTIPRNVRLAEAPSYGKSALEYDPRSRGAESYIKLAKEIMGRLSGTRAAGKKTTEALMEAAIGVSDDVREAEAVAEDN
jgi:chromosome partitioning protein